MTRKKKKTRRRTETKRLVDKLTPPGWTADKVRRLLCNPIYAGVGPYPAIMSRKDWIDAAKVSIKEIGVEAFFEGMFEELDYALGYAADVGAVAEKDKTQKD